MKALISGMGGWIGSSLANKLLLEGWDVLPIKRPYYSQRTDLYDLMMGFKPDVVFHCGAYGNMYQDIDPDKMIDGNINTTLRLLEASRDVEYKSFVFLSSAAVYGKSNTSMHEDDKVFPESMYAITKHTAENLCLHYRRKYKKNILIPRLFSVYGPGEADFRFIPTIVKSLMSGNTMSLDQKASHSWIYIDEVVSYLINIAIGNKLTAQPTINIGSSKTTTNQEIVDVLERISDIKLNYLSSMNLRPDQSRSVRCDNTYAKNITYVPHVKLIDGLSKTYEYYKKKYSEKT